MISIVSLNTCGIRSRIEIPEFLETCKLHDILCFSETKLDNTLNDLVYETFSNIGFHVFLKHRKSMARHKSGGLMIAVKKSLLRHVTYKENENQLSQWIEINSAATRLNENIVLGNIYIPPKQSKYSVSDPFEKLEQEIYEVMSDENCIILCGDFNSHTGTLNDYVTVEEDIHVQVMDSETSASLNQHEILKTLKTPLNRQNKETAKPDHYGHKLVELCKCAGIMILNGRKETDHDCGRPTTSCNTLIDYVISSPRLWSKITNFKVHSFDPIYSDIHCMLSFAIQARDRKQERAADESHPEPPVVGKWDSSKKQEYVNEVEMIATEIKQRIINNEKFSAKELASKLNNVLIESAKKIFPPRSNTRKKKSNKKNIPWYSRQCSMLKRDYYRALNSHRQLRNQQSHQCLINKSKLYRQGVKKAKREYLSDLNRKLQFLKSNDPKAYWSILNHKEHEQINVHKNELTEHFKSLSLGDESFNDSLPEPTDVDDLNVASLNDRFTDAEILKATAKLKNNKSVGEDNIANEYLKSSIHVILPIVNVLFNEILDSGSIPSEWSNGLIVPVFKKGDTSIAANYRGITLLSCLGKLFTCIVNERLTKLLDDNNLLCENQTGFRNGYSTLDHCFLLKHLVDIYKASGKKLFCAFIDYKQAFDRLWRNGLWHKLTKMGITGKLYDVIVNMYENVKSCVKANGSCGDYFACKVGVRQGENLSPLLFSLYLNDLEEFLVLTGNSSLSYNFDICNTLLKIFVIMYADDTVLLSNSAKGLQKLLDSFSAYCKHWKLTVNVTKTNILVFGKRKYKGKFVFKYNNCPIDIVDNFKYLGLTFSFNGNFKMCRKNLSGQAQRAMFSLLCKCRKYELSLDTSLELFDRTILPILTYGCEIWGFEKDSIIENLHLKFCKYILGLKKSTPNVMIYGETGRTPVEVTIKVRSLMFWFRLVNGRDSKLSVKMYNCLYQLYTTAEYRSPWLEFIEGLLNEVGLTFVWLLQGDGINGIWLKQIVKTRLTDQYITKWRESMEMSSKCDYYKLFKPLHERERYLSIVHSQTYKLVLKFRTCNHRLPIETGRYNNIERRFRLCQQCEQHQLGDEYHYLCKCTNPDIVDARCRFLPNVFNFNFQRFCNFLSNLKDEETVINLAKFLKVIFNIVS